MRRRWRRCGQRQPWRHTTRWRFWRREWWWRPGCRHAGHRRRCRRTAGSARRRGRGGDRAGSGPLAFRQRCPGAAPACDAGLPACRRLQPDAKRMGTVYGRPRIGDSNNLDPLPAPLAATAAPARPRSAAPNGQPAPPPPTTCRRCCATSSTGSSTCSARSHCCAAPMPSTCATSPSAPRRCATCAGLPRAAAFCARRRSAWPARPDSGYDNGIQGLRSIGRRRRCCFFNGTAAEFEFDNGATTVAIGTVTPADAAAGSTLRERVGRNNSIVCALRWVGAEGFVGRAAVSGHHAGFRAPEPLELSDPMHRHPQSDGRLSHRRVGPGATRCRLAERVLLARAGVAGAADRLC